MVTQAAVVCQQVASSWWQTQGPSNIHNFPSEASGWTLTHSNRRRVQICFIGGRDEPAHKLDTLRMKNVESWWIVSLLPQSSLAGRCLKWSWFLFSESTITVLRLLEDLLECKINWLLVLSGPTNRLKPALPLYCLIGTSSFQKICIFLDAAKWIGC